MVRQKGKMMCFSPQASFGAALFLAAMGLALLIKIKKKKEYFLAAVPFLFAIQQASEGVVWLSFLVSNLRSLRYPAASIFLTFAFVMWPSFIPYSLWYCEPEQKRKKYMIIPLCIGLLVSLFLAYMLVVRGFSVDLMQHHIVYYLPIGFYWLVTATGGYLCATILPSFISSRPYMPFFGITLGSSYVLTYYFYQTALVSVWCFFGALLSLMLFYVVE